MSIGIAPSKAQIDNTAGSIAAAVDAALTRVRQFKYFLDGTLDSDLIALGYTAGEVATLRSAFADLDGLGGAYRGESAVAVAKDFRTFARRVWGLGSL